MAPVAQGDKLCWPEQSLNGHICHLCHSQRLGRLVTRYCVARCRFDCSLSFSEKHRSCHPGRHQPNSLGTNLITQSSRLGRSPNNEKDRTENCSHSENP